MRLLIELEVTSSSSRVTRSARGEERIGRVATRLFLTPGSSSGPLTRNKTRLCRNSPRSVPRGAQVTRVGLEATAPLARHRGRTDHPAGVQQRPVELAGEHAA